MAEQAYAYVTLIPVAKGFQKAIANEMSGVTKEASKVGKTSGKAFGSAFKSAYEGIAKTAIAGIGVGLTAIAGSVASGFARLTGIEEAQAKLRGLGNTTEDVSMIMDNALSAVRGTAFRMSDAATIAASAVAAGIQPGEELARYLKLTADSAYIAGVELSDMGLILNKAQTTGRATNEVLQQLAERGIPIYQMLGDQIGATAGEIFDLASEGEISSEILMNAIENNIAGAALKSGDTVMGAFNNMGAAIQRVGANLIGPIFGNFKDFFLGVINFLGPAEDAAKQFGQIIADRVNPVFERLNGFLNNTTFELGDMSKVLSPTTGAMAALAGGALAPFASTLPLIGRFLPVVNPLFAILVGGLAALAILSPELGNQMKDSFGQIMEAVSGAISAIMPAVQEVLPILIDLFTTLVQSVLPVVVALVTALAPIIADLVIGFAGVVTAIAPLITAILPVLSDMLLKYVIPAISALVGWMVDNLIGAINGVIAWFQSLDDKAEATGNWFTSIWENHIKPFVDKLGMAFQWVYDNILFPVFSGIMLAVGLMAAAFEFAWENFISPFIDWVGGGLQMLYENLIVPVGEAIGVAITAVGEMFQWVYDNLLKPMFDAFGEAYQFVLDEIVTPISDTITQVFEDLGTAVNDIFTGIGTFIEDTFKAMVNAVRDPLNSIIGFVNQVIGAINSIKVDIPDWVPVWGGRSIGFNIPRVAQIPAMAKGGYVDSPTFAMVGEAGPEVVMPLDRFESMMGLNQAGQGKTVNYYAAPNQSISSEQALFTAMRRAKVVANW